MQELGTFVISYPCWALVHEASIVRDSNGKPIRYTSPMKFVILDDPQGSTLPLFTDGDLAKRFTTDSGDMEGIAVVAVTSPDMLAGTLRMFEGTADAVSFDQPKLRHRPYGIWPLKYALQKVLDGQKL